MQLGVLADNLRQFSDLELVIAKFELGKHLGTTLIHLFTLIKPGALGRLSKDSNSQSLRVKPTRSSNFSTQEQLDMKRWIRVTQSILDVLGDLGDL